MSKASKIKKSKSSIPLERQNFLNHFKLIMLIAILIIVFCSPFIRGLYFEPEQLMTQIVLFTLFIAFWIYKWLKSDKCFLKTPIDYASIGLVLIFFLSCLTAVSQRLAISEFLKYAMYFVVFFMLSDLVKTEREKLISLWFIVASALGLCVIGIDSVAGSKIVNLLNAIFKSLHLDFEFYGLFVDGRIHSTLQYPNAFASYLMAVFLITISLSMTSSKWIKSVLSSISFILLTTFIFTISRGAYILIVFAVIMFLLLLPRESKLEGVYSIFIVGIITASFVAILSRIIFSESSNKIYVWLFVILGMLISFFIRLFDNYVIEILKKISWKVALVSSLILVIVSSFVISYVFNASVPLEIWHSIEEKEGFIDVKKSVKLYSNKKYKLVFNVEGESLNEKAPFVYKVYIKSRETGISTNNEILIEEQMYNSTTGIEKKEIEFIVPENGQTIIIGFQNYYSGTSAKFYDAKIYELESGKQVKSLILKHKYAIAESVLSRFENLTGDNNYFARLVYLKDGIKIFKDWWLIGAGGGAWSILNFKYQSYLYWSTQTHNYPLQVIIETGFIGLIILLILFTSIVLCFGKLLRRNREEGSKSIIVNAALFTSIIFLFLHSFMDFNLSLSAIYLLVWTLISLLNSEVRNYKMKEEVSKNKNKTGKYHKAKLSTESLKAGINDMPLVMTIITVLIMIYPIKFSMARIAANKALISFGEGNIDEAIEYMDKAITYDHLDTQYVIGYTPISSRKDVRIGYIDLVLKKFDTISKEINNEERAVLNNYVTNARKYAEKIEKFSKHNPEVMLNLGVYYLNTNDKEKGIDYINKSVELKPLVPAQWFYKANANYALAVNYLKENNNEKALEYVDQIIGMIDEATKVNSANLTPFVFNDDTQKYIEKAVFIKENIDKNVGVEDLVFQSILDMDLNRNGIPDQWSLSNKTALEVKLEDGIFKVKCKKPDENPYIYTRNLDFEPNNVYKIEVKLSNEQDLKPIDFTVLGIWGKLEQENPGTNIYSAEITSPDDLTDKNKLLLLYMNDDYFIEGVRVIKK